MPIIQISKIQHRSGNIDDLPQLDAAEIGVAVDLSTPGAPQNRIFVGPIVPVYTNTSPTSNNIELLSQFSGVSFTQIRLADSSNGGRYYPVMGNLTSGNLWLWGNANLSFDVPSGTLNSTILNVSDNGTIGNNLVVGGNLYVDGDLTYINVTTLAIEDPLIEQGGGANGGFVPAADIKDRGAVYHFYGDGVTFDTLRFNGWDSSNAEFAFSNDVTLNANETVTINSLGNVRFANANVHGNIMVQGGTISTTQLTFELVNTTATTVNFAGAATNINMGAAGGGGTLTVRNDNVTLNGDLQVKGGDITTNQTTFNLLNTNATNINFGGAGTEIQIGAATGNSNVKNNLRVSGNANITGDANIVGNANIAGNINLTSTTAAISTTTGALIIAGGVGIAGNIYAGGNANVTGTANIGGNANVAGNAYILGNANITGTANISANANVAGNAYILGNANISSEANVGGNANITGNVNVVATTAATSTTSGALIVAGGAGIAGNAYIGGNANITGNINVVATTAATSTTSGAIIIAGGAGIAGNAYIGGNSNITGTANIGANANIAGNAYVLGNANITGTANIGANANIAGNAYVLGNANITGTANIGANANIAGNAYILGNANISSEANIGGNANVAGNAYVLGNANITGTANIGANANIAGNAYVLGNANITGTANIGANANIAGNAYILGNANITGTANISANANIAGNAYILGNANVTGEANIGGNANVAGNAYILGTANITGTANIGANANIAGNAFILGNANVTGEANIGGNANIAGNAYIIGNANVTGSVNTAAQLITTIATGTAPLVVTSTTRVNNLYVQGANEANIQPVSVGNYYLNFSSATSGNLVLNANTAFVANAQTGTLYATTFSGNFSGNFAAPGTNKQVIFNDALTMNANANFTFDKATGNVSAGAFVSTISTGTPPLGVASTTRVSGLYVQGANEANIQSVSAGTYYLNFSGTVSGNQVLNANSSISVDVSTGVVSGLYATGISGSGRGMWTGNGVISGSWTLAPGATFEATYADLAEYYISDQPYEPGTVVEFGGDYEVTLASDETMRLAGVVSTNPAYAMNANANGQYTVALALVGRVPCKVRGTIKKGDLMTSGGNGYARPSQNPKIGTIIGKSLEDFSGVGVIEIAVHRH